jgi:hypothetical protein
MIFFENLRKKMLHVRAFAFNLLISILFPLTRQLLRKCGRKKNDFTSKSILMYSPQKDKALNTSKKEGRNGGISS